MCAHHNNFSVPWSRYHVKPTWKMAAADEPQVCRTSKKVTRRRPHICDACSKQFETPSKLARHYLTHTGQKPYQCEDCSKTFRQLVHLERHMMTHMLPLKCNVCLRHFKNAETFTKHQQMHNKPPPNETRAAKKSASVYCFGCKRTFASEEKRLFHQCDFMNVTANKKPEPQRCDFCKKLFPSHSKLERHLMIHTGQKPFACDVCGKLFRQKTHLKIHLLTHTQEEPFQCSHCFKKFKQRGKLVEHEERHTNLSKVRRKKSISGTGPSQFKDESNEIFSVYSTPFQCASCKQCLETKELFDSHTCLEADTNKESVQQNKIHKIVLDPDNENLPTASEQVGKFLKLGDLVDPEHMDTREPGNQPSGACRNVLQLHQKQQIRKAKRKYLKQPQMHMGGRLQNHKFGINFQGMLGKGNNQLVRSTIHAYGQGEPGEEHDTLTHFLQGAQDIFLPQNKVSSCDQCDKTFPSISKLQRHYLIHTGQKPFTCTECGKTFRQSAHLKRHQVTHIQKVLSQGGLEDYYSTFRLPQKNLSYLLSQHSSSSGESIPNLDQVTVIVVPEIKVETESSNLAVVSKKTLIRRKTRVSMPRERSTKFHQQRPLQRMRTRAFRKSYKCSVCTKNFLSPSKLERHYLMHAGQRPFECPECGKSFRQDPHLKRHMLTHNLVKD